jgi:hypothetical protein
MYKVKVNYKLKTKFLIEGKDTMDAKANAVRQLHDRHSRRPNVSRKLKTVYTNAVATACDLSKAPFYSVSIDADVCQTCYVYAENETTAKAEGVRQITHAHRERSGQIAFASEIEAVEAVKVPA